jgi:hypothetical protein
MHAAVVLLVIQRLAVFQLDRAHSVCKYVCEYVCEHVCEHIFRFVFQHMLVTYGRVGERL